MSLWSMSIYRYSESVSEVPSRANNDIFLSSMSLRQRNKKQGFNILYEDYVIVGLGISFGALGARNNAVSVRYLNLTLRLDLQIAVFKKFLFSIITQHIM